MISFNKIVNKLCKKCGNIVFLTDIFEIIDPDQQEKNRTILNKLVYRLKAEWHLIPLKNGVYIIPDNEDNLLNAVDLIDKYYLKLLKKYITKEVGNSYFISGKKSLEIHLRDYSLPEKIYICNRTVNKKVKIWIYEIVFKTIWGKQQGKKINLYAKFCEYYKIFNIEWIDFKVAGLELALLEWTLIGENYNGVDVQILTKCIKKYRTVLDEDIFREIAKYKYIMSFNRLKELSKHIDESLYLVFLDIIKRNGNLFIGQWVRAI